MGRRGGGRLGGGCLMGPMEEAGGECPDTRRPVKGQRRRWGAREREGSAGVRGGKARLDCNPETRRNPEAALSPSGRSREGAVELRVLDAPAQRRRKCEAMPCASGFSRNSGFHPMVRFGTRRLRRGSGARSSHAEFAEDAEARARDSKRTTASGVGERGKARRARRSRPTGFASFVASCEIPTRRVGEKPRVSAQPRGNDSAYGEELGRAEPMA